MREENYESVKPADAMQEGKPSGFSQYAVERNNPQELLLDRQQGTDRLVGKGILPSIDVLQVHGDFRTGTEVSARDLREAGIKCKREKGADGREQTSATYPNGLKVTVIEGTTITRENGGKVEIGPTSLIEVSPPAREQPKASGIFVDGAGRQIAKVNEDGSVTVDAGEGFYTQYADGITKETAIRSRDRKTWTVVNTKDPLGGLRPSN